MSEQNFQRRQLKVKVEPNTTIVIYDPLDQTYNFINGGCPKSKAEYEEFLKEELTFRDVLLIVIEALPSIDGNLLIKPKAKSTDRHKREAISKIAETVHLSVASLRRGYYIQKYGSKEINDLCRDGKLSIWKAYNFVKRENEKKLIAMLLAEKEKLKKAEG